MPKYKNLRNIGVASHEAIIEYWKDRITKFKICENQCFACGSPHRLDRCHIIPYARGGTNDASNLHILCSTCHIESEGLEGYHGWFRDKQKKAFQNPLNHIYFKIEKYGFDKNDFKEFFKSSKNPQTIYENVMTQIYFLKYMAPLFQ